MNLKKLNEKNIVRLFAKYLNCFLSILMLIVFSLHIESLVHVIQMLTTGTLAAQQSSIEAQSKYKMSMTRYGSLIEMSENDQIAFKNRNDDCIECNSQILRNIACFNSKLLLIIIIDYYY